MEWQPTDCHKPYKPSLFVVDVNSFNGAVEEFNGYVSEVKNYIKCLVQEAQGDLEELPRIVSEGVNRAQNEVMIEVEDLRSDLELQRTLLQ